MSADPVFFLTQPAISTNGTLSFKPARNVVVGSTIVAVYLKDSGDTANGGINRSLDPVKTFMIVILPANDAPATPVRWTIKPHW